MAGRLHAVPAWWDDLTAFAAARHHPSGAIVILREAGRLLGADPDASPQQLLDRCAPTTGTAGGHCAHSSPAAACLCPETTSSAVPRHGGAASSMPFQTAWPPRSPPSTAASSQNRNEPGGPGGARSATSPWRPGSGSSATWPSTSHPPGR